MAVNLLRRDPMAISTTNSALNPMISLFPPSTAKIEAMLADLKSAESTWQFQTGFEPRAGFNVDQCRTWLGSGQTAWNAAVLAMDEWLVMPQAMVELIGKCPLEAGRIVAVKFRGLGVHSVNPCRISEVVKSKSDSLAEYGFVYVTLPGHVEAGMERFLLQWDRETDQVWYEVKAISRPRHLLAWLAYPYTRNQQQRFRELSAAQMLAAVMARAIEKTDVEPESDSDQQSDGVLPFSSTVAAAKLRS